MALKPATVFCSSSSQVTERDARFHVESHLSTPMCHHSRAQKQQRHRAPAPRRSPSPFPHTPHASKTFLGNISFALMTRSTTAWPSGPRPTTSMSTGLTSLARGKDWGDGELLSSVLPSPSAVAPAVPGRTYRGGLFEQCEPGCGSQHPAALPGRWTRVGVWRHPAHAHH